MPKHITKKQFREHGWKHGDKVKTLNGNVWPVRTIDYEDVSVYCVNKHNDSHWFYVEDIAEIIPKKTNAKLPPPEHCTPQFVQGFNEWKPKKGGNGK